MKNRYDTSDDYWTRQMHLRFITQDTSDEDKNLYEIGNSVERNNFNVDIVEKENKQIDDRFLSSLKFKSSQI